MILLYEMRFETKVLKTDFLDFMNPLNNHYSNGTTHLTCAALISEAILECI